MSTRYLGNVPLKAPPRGKRARGRRRIRGLELSSNISVPSVDCSGSEDVSGLSLREWGLPPCVFEVYASLGVTSLFPWQSECLRRGRALEGGNLVYSAPTSGGKTLVAEILLLKAVIERKKKALFILPFVSLAREKMKSLQKLLSGSNLRVEGWMGSLGPRGGLARADVAVCTIEKANGLLNRAMEEGKGLESIGIVVVDELHLVGDASRGYLLELMLTKMRYIARDGIQIVGMSATLPNLDLIAEWLNADLYVTDFRPTPLTEMIKVDNVLYSNAFERIKVLDSLSFIKNDTDLLIQLCLETVVEGHSVLVFCPTKSWCEKVAEAIAKEFFNIGNQNGPVKSEEFSYYGTLLRKELDGLKLKAVIESLKKTPAGLDPLLSKTVAFGVAFHHAGLTMDERDIVENSFKLGILRILVATSTLSSGVNLPARRVIIRSPFTYQNQLIDSLSYRQMIGRAGRKGIDTKGESILFCRSNDRAKVEELIKSNLGSVQSCLVQFKGDHLCSSMKRAILEIIAGNVAKNKEEVQRYTSCTMLAASLRRDGSQSDIPEDSLSNCIEFLESNEFIRTQEVSSSISYVPTQLGLACLASSLSPDEGLQVFDELNKARKCFVLENELHIVYLLVPIYAAVSWPNLDWMNYLTLWESLSLDLKRVGEIVGIEERFLIRAMRGTVNTSVPKQMKSMATHQRFYTALALNDLVNEVPLSEVTKKYGASKGMLQSLQQAASTFAGMVTVFSARLGWHNLELLISQFQNRLQFGVQRELIDLCRLSTLNGQRARVLYNASLDSVASLANSSALAIENILSNSSPFESRKKTEEETERDAKERAELRTFWITGLKGVTIKEGAEMILAEARALLQKDLGMELNWSKDQEEQRDDSSHKKRRQESANTMDSVQKTKLTQRMYKIPNASMTQKSILKSPRVEIRSSKKRKSEELSIIDKSDCNTSLNISSIVDEIFEGEGFSVIQPSQNGKKRVSFGGRDDSETDMFGNEDDNIFLDSWKVEDIESTKLSKDVKTGNTTTNNKSCPETPKYEACSEELDIWESGSSNVDEDVFADSVISDSLLEKAFNTHMMGNDESFMHENAMAEESTVSHEKMNVIDVCSSKDIFKEFSKEVLGLKDPLCFSVAATKFTPIKPSFIGNKFKKTKNEPPSRKLFAIDELELVLDGVAFSWGQGNNDAYYLGLNPDQKNPDDTICPPTQDVSITIDERKILLENIFRRLKTFIGFEMKEQLKALYLGTGIWPNLKDGSRFKDPKIASWLLNPGGKEKTLSSLVMEFCPLAAPLLATLGSHKGSGSVGLCGDSERLSRSRSLAEVLLTKNLMAKMEDKLNSLDLYRSFQDVEMPSILSFLSMELNGVGFSEEESTFQRNLIIEKMEELEQEAYKLGGRTFSLTSSDDLSKILYFELKLPPNGVESNVKKSFLSTNKETLIKLKKFHKLPAVILEWRKLNASITKVVYPMQRAKSYHNTLQMNRIYTIVLTNTSTGRISLVEPNIQNIPKDFEIAIKSSSLHETSISFCSDKGPLESVTSFLNSTESNKEKYKVSMRHSIIASKDSLIVAADYSQLELRILAHLCGDARLKSILNDGQDVFKLIASKWKKKEVWNITDAERQSAKQMCYGILYGIGPKALGEQLGVPEEEAAVFMGDFKDTFPQIRSYIESTVSKCRKLGYVTTMTGRRRYLPNIQTSRSALSASYIISHAERQAVNTTIQGSAADLVKMAMNNINQNIWKLFKDSVVPLRKNESKRKIQEGGYFILQIHDELLYEVASRCISDVARMIKVGMEKACTLSIVTPVSIKVGPSWGSLQNFEF